LFLLERAQRAVKPPWALPFAGMGFFFPGLFLSLHEFPPMVWYAWAASGMQGKNPGTDNEAARRHCRPGVVHDRCFDFAQAGSLSI